MCILFILIDFTLHPYFPTICGSIKRQLHKTTSKYLPILAPSNKNWNYTPSHYPTLHTVELAEFGTMLEHGNPMAGDLGRDRHKQNESASLDLNKFARSREIFGVKARVGLRSFFESGNLHSFWFTGIPSVGLRGSLPDPCRCIGRFEFYGTCIYTLECHYRRSS